MGAGEAAAVLAVGEVVPQLVQVAAEALVAEAAEVAVDLVAEVVATEAEAQAQEQARAMPV